MRRLDDETLMAYADAALELERRLIEGARHRGSCARRRVAFFRLPDDIARHAFAVPMWCASPRHMVDCVLRSTSCMPERIATWQRLHLGLAVSRKPKAITASTATTAATLSWYMLMPAFLDQEISPGPASRGCAFTEVLNDQSSMVESNAHLALVVTLKDKPGSACPEVDVFDERLAALPSAALVAWRDEIRHWTAVGAGRPKSVNSACAESYRVPTDDAAHAATVGIHNMIGATQSASAIKHEGKTQ